MLIEITRGLQGWRAVFYGGDMPQRVALPLPFTYSAAESIVRADLAKRFPGATIETPYRDESRREDVLNRIERMKW